MSESGNLGVVVVAVDGSEERMNALRWALENLKLRSPTPDSTAAGDLEVPAFAAAIEAHQKRITDSIFYHALGICSTFDTKVRTHVVVGDPKEKICETVQDLHADVLVIGSRAFGPIKRMFLGSVSNCCAHHSECPVIIIKGKDGVNKGN